MDALRRFGESGVIIWRAHTAWASPHFFVAARAVGPVFQVLLFTLLGLSAGGPGSVAFFLIGNAAVLAGFGGLAVATTLTQEGVQETLPYLVGAPGSRLAKLGHRLPVPILDGLFGVVFAFAVVGLLLRPDLSRADPVALAAGLLAAAVSAASVGFLVGLLALVRFDVYVVWNSLYAVLLILTGASVPIAALPGWAQPVSQAVPMTHAILAARLAASGAGLTRVAPLLAIELVVGAAYVVVGWLLLAREEAVLRRRGAPGL